MTTPVPQASRLALHLVLTVGGALALAGGEVAGNLLFRGGQIDRAQVGGLLIAGAVLGNVVALMLWITRKRSKS